MENKVIRNSNFELLRIVSMFSIVIGHFWTHGLGGMSIIDNFSLQMIFVAITGSLSTVGVVVFVLISAYFLSTGEWKIERVSKFISQVFFYSIIIIGLVVALISLNISSIEEMKIESLGIYIFKQFFSFLSGYQWFISAYFVMILLSPFYNKLFKSLSDHKKIQLIFTLGLISVIIPTFTGLSFGYTSNLLFALLYFIGALIREKENNFTNKKIYGWLFIANWCLIILSFFVIGIIGKRIYFLKTFERYFLGQNNILVITAGIFLFLFFKNLKLRHNKFVNYLGGLMFGVYMIHDAVGLKHFYYNNLIISDFSHANFFVAIANWLMTVNVLFFGSLVIALIYKEIFSRFMEPLFNKVFQNIEKAAVKLKTALTEKLFKNGSFQDEC